MNIPQYADVLAKLHWFIAVQLAGLSNAEWLELHQQLRSAVSAQIERHGLNQDGSA